MATETTFGRALDRYRPTRDYRVGHYKLRVRGSQTPEAILRVFTRAAIVFREPAQLLLTIIELLVHSPVPPSPLKECIRYCKNNIIKEVSAYMPCLASDNIVQKH